MTKITFKSWGKQNIKNITDQLILLKGVTYVGV